MDIDRYYRLAQQVTLLALRGITTVSKFGLALYTARFLGLAELGIYGLLVGAATIVPACFGFGVTDLIRRQVANMRLPEAMPYMTTRLLLSLATHLVGQPLAWMVNSALGAPIPWAMLLPIGLIILLEHLSADAQDMMTLRGRVRLANFILFINAGAWPPLVIAWGLLDPTARALDNILYGWLGALGVAWIVMLLQLLPEQRWRLLGLRPQWPLKAIRSSVPFYVKDITGVASVFLDRFLVSLFLGLEMAGVYTFFWSVANVANSLVGGVIQTHITALMQAGAASDSERFARAERRLQIDVLGWSALLAGSALAAMPLLLPFLGRPLLQDHLAVFWIIMLATLFRIGADGYGLVLLAHRRDRAIAVISVAGAIASAALNLLLVPFVGLYGAAFAYTLTSAGLLVARVSVSRSPHPQAGRVPWGRERIAKPSAAKNA